MTDYSKGHGDPAELRRALEAADALISRIEDLIADHLAKKEALDETEAFYEVVQALEIAPEIATIRMALGDAPSRFGEPTPLASGDHTG